MNQNSVELIGWYGGDIAIARAAWTSTNIHVESKSKEQIEDLIVNKLVNNDTGKPHLTPFERGIVEFNITCDVASHIHLIKHRHANINGESARYKELKEDKFYLPKDWTDLKYNRNRFDQENTGESKSQLIWESNFNWLQILENYTNIGNDLYHEFLKDSKEILTRKRAKESGRYFKTYNSQITLSVMMNMSCFINFQKLRNDNSAQIEIQDISNTMLYLVENIPNSPFKHTLKAFNLISDKHNLLL